MSEAYAVAKRFLIEDYLQIEPDFLSMTEWLDEQGDIDVDASDVEIHDEVISLLDTLAQRLDDEEN